MCRLSMTTSTAEMSSDCCPVQSDLGTSLLQHYPYRAMIAAHEVCEVKAIVHLIQKRLFNLHSMYQNLNAALNLLKPVFSQYAD